MPEEQQQVKTTVRLPLELHRKAKAHAALVGMPLQDVIESLLKQWVTNMDRSLKLRERQRGEKQ